MKHVFPTSPVSLRGDINKVKEGLEERLYLINGCSGLCECCVQLLDNAHFFHILSSEVGDEKSFHFDDLD